jgi:hypothetical protein
MRVLLLLALLAVPLMLYVKPIYQTMESKKHNNVHHESENAEPTYMYHAINDDNHSNSHEAIKSKSDLLEILNKQEVKKAHSFGDFFIH